MSEMQANAAPSGVNGSPNEKKAKNAAAAALWLGIIGAVASAAATYLLIRAFAQKRPSDETAERIQSLIDEANRLIRTLDEKK